MAFGKRAKKQSAQLVEQTREFSEDLLDAAAEYLRLRRKPGRSQGEDAWAFITGLTIGALASGAAAVFLAPTDGQTLRGRLRHKLDELLGTAPYEPPPPYMPRDPEAEAAEAASLHPMPAATMAGAAR